MVYVQYTIYTCGVMILKLILILMYIHIYCIVRHTKLTKDIFVGFRYSMYHVSYQYVLCAYLRRSIDPVVMTVICNHVAEYGATFHETAHV
jgi:hypothetical protein